MNKEVAEYLKLLEERRTQGRVTTDFQLTGLALAEILQDEAHKSLYIKLAKEGDARKLIQLAKEVAERPNITNKGAYFMKVLTSDS